MEHKGEIMGFVRIMCFVVVVVMISGERANGTNFTVGGTTGWTIPSQTNFYESWADDKDFRVGDQLTFIWSGTHDVAVVTETDYEGCTKVSNVSSTGPVTITLDTIGDKYFICTIGTHCQSGQKLEIEVKASNTTAGSPPSTPTNGTTPSPPPPPSSATSFAPVASLCATISFLVFSFLA